MAKSKLIRDFWNYRVRKEGETDQREGEEEGSPEVWGPPPNKSLRRFSRSKGIII